MNRQVRIHKDENDCYIAIIVEVKGYGVINVDDEMIEKRTGKYLYFTRDGFLMGVGEMEEAEVVISYISEE